VTKLGSEVVSSQVDILYGSYGSQLNWRQRLAVMLGKGKSYHFARSGGREERERSGGPAQKVSKEKC